MIRLLDSLFPWFGDMLDLGGNILLLIIVVAMLIGGLLLERFYFLFFVYPQQISTAQELWQQPVTRAWLRPYRLTQLRSRLLQNLNTHLSLVKVLIALCPLLGLLGTVLGMLEVFDAVAITGANSPRVTASGVSKATVSTMAGMLVAITGLLLLSLVTQKVGSETDKISRVLTLY